MDLLLYLTRLSAERISGKTPGGQLRRCALPLRTDHAAKEIVLRRFALPECLHVPIAAADEAAIRDYIGEVSQVLVAGRPNKALLVRVGMPPPRDLRLPLWQLETSEMLFHPLQVWVHIKYNGYRSAYRKAFPEESISGKVLSHAMNRRVAALKGFDFVRITPTSRGTNSSSGFSEQWGVALFSQPEEIESFKRRGAFIAYADLSELMVMMDIKIGGGVMAAVNEGQKLVRPAALYE